MTKPLQVHCTYTSNDYMSFFMFRSTQNNKNFRKLKYILLGIPLLYIIISIGVYFFDTPIDKKVAFVLVPAAFAWYILYPIMKRKQYERHYRNYIQKHVDCDLGTETLIEIDSANIHLKDPKNEAKISTDEIAEIQEVNAYFFIVLKSASGIILPHSQISKVEETRKYLMNLSDDKHIKYSTFSNWKWKM